MKPIHAIPTIIFSAAIAAVSGACVDDTEVAGDGDETGTPFDGVYVNCFNEDYLNSWWNFGPGGISVQLFGAGHGVLPLNACIGSDNMGEYFDLVADYDQGVEGYPAFDAEIRGLCTRRCRIAHQELTGRMAVCKDENWSGHAVRESGYDPKKGGNCDVAKVHPLVISDPYASDIDWNEGVGSRLRLPLDCSLLHDCADVFDANIDEWALAFASGGVFDFIAPDSRGAAFHAVTGEIGTSIALDMNSGDGAGHDDENLLEGHAEYSPSYCDHSTCPFYLAAFEAGNYTDEWAIYLDVPPVVSEHKEISNVQIEMLQSALAVWRPSTGQVAFPSGSLVLQVDFDLTSETCTESCNHIGDGRYSKRLINPDVVFGTFDPLDGSLTLNYRFPVIGGEASLTAELTADGHPPEAAMNLALEAHCNHPDGYQLTVDENNSTDPDSDLDYIVWLVDGVVRSSGYVIPIGTHTIDLLAVDDRGAHVLAGSQALEVLHGPACL